PMGRQQVHLSERREDATEVGRRHGRPVILEVAARHMHEEGFVFSRATDRVWLVDEVPSGYLTRAG
ncbi:MAG: RNA 2'-phosphotransferase, partial [Nitriliruptorales bacterium]|nr:RNA 2'-phosphotransferase [Nitriliruptorales bacterium]